MLTFGAAGAALAASRRSSAAPDSDLRIIRAQPSGYDGAVPGPVLRMHRGEELRIRLVNELSQPTALHWHGVDAANAMDGAPPLTQDAIAPGDSFDYRIVAPDAGTYWYHPPAWPQPPAPRGLYGLLIVAETEPVDIDRDVTLVVDQTAAVGDGDKTAPLRINGMANFDVDAAANERLRLRLLNASAQPIVVLRIENLRVFFMATDGEPAEPFTVREGRLLLASGNRIDVFVDCTLDPGAAAPIVIEHPGDPNPIGRIVCNPVAPGRRAPRPDPVALPPNPLPARMDFAGAFRFEVILGRRDRPVLTKESPLFTVRRGRTVVLTISNPTSEIIVIHLHGHHFRRLDALDDGWAPFWLDTQPVAARSRSHIAFVADNPGHWAIEGVGAGNGGEPWFEVV